MVLLTCILGDQQISSNTDYVQQVFVEWMNPKGEYDHFPNFIAETTSLLCGKAKFQTQVDNSEVYILLIFF